MVNCGAAANAEVLNQRLTDRSSEGRDGSPTRLGRWVPNPAKALLLVVCAIATGMPDCSVSTPVSVQSLISAPVSPLARRLRPSPNGTSHTADATNTCGM